MKLSKRTIFISILVLVFLFFVGFLLGFLLTKSSSETKVAFYDLNEVQQKAFTEQLEKLADSDDKKISYQFTELDSSKPLASQIKNKFDLILTPMGQNANEAVELISKKNSIKISLPQSILEGTTISVKQSVIKNEKGNISVLPLLLDNFEIDIDKTFLNKCKIKNITSWQDIEKFALAAQEYVKNPITFAGGDSETLLGVVGALTEAFSGKQAYTEAVKTIRESIYENNKDSVPTSSDYSKIIESLSKDVDSPLFNAIQALTRWQRLGLINTEAFNMKQQDVAAFMEAKYAPITFMTLSQHRNIEHNTIERYSSIYFPSERNATQRFFIAPVISAIPFSKNKNLSYTIQQLISSTAQEQIGKTSGLAPVLANCHVADHQADDVRYWIAATNAPLVPMGKAIFTDQETKDAFAKELGSYIRYSIK